MKTYPKIALFALFTVTLAFAASGLAPIVVAIGPSEFPEGDSVTITEVLSDSPDLDVGSRVLVRGRYTLASEKKARIGLSLSTVKLVSVPISPGSGMNITKGSGEFELVFNITEAGCMRVALNQVKPGPSFGTVFFGTPEQLARARRAVQGWVK